MTSSGPGPHDEPVDIFERQEFPADPPAATRPAEPTASDLLQPPVRKRMPLWVFALVGVAWAAINVNSYPMVVEISKSADVGQFTGYYYTFSMAAQIVTPILSGYLMQFFGYRVLAPYAAVMVAISFVTISLTRHGDAKPTKPAEALEAFDVEGD